MIALWIGEVRELFRRAEAQLRDFEIAREHVDRALVTEQREPAARFELRIALRAVERRDQRVGAALVIAARERVGDVELRDFARLVLHRGREQIERRLVARSRERGSGNALHARRIALLLRGEHGLRALECGGGRQRWRCVDGLHDAGIVDDRRLDFGWRRLAQHEEVDAHQPPAEQRA